MFDRLKHHLILLVSLIILLGPKLLVFLLLLTFWCENVASGSAPLTAVQLLWVNMIMDTLGALALATEPPTDELMKRLPVGRRGSFISNVMWRNILGQSFYQFSVIWFLQAKGKSTFGLDGPDSDLILNTLIFNSFVFCQVHTVSNLLHLCYYEKMVDDMIKSNHFLNLYLLHYRNPSTRIILDLILADFQRNKFKGDGQNRCVQRNT